ncbi:class I SAM-dependent methyltransferase [Nostoc sp.]|uniref:class I SAM-dependent methyltransferase n=1 Tax=Nostoc sp. TaxID=1180 RepID=UPI002FFC75B4
MLRKILNFIDNSLTSLHHKWWNFLNWHQQYQVEPFSVRYWWTRQQIVTEVCDHILTAPEDWKTYIRDPRFQFYDERIVEYSWAMRHISQLGKKERFLDVGCVMNTHYCLEKLLQQFSDIHFLNLVSEPLALQGRISFHSQDIRQCNLPPHSFDCITCISTLEHVGGDNSYNSFSLNGSAETQASPINSVTSWQQGFTELLRLLTTDGLLLVSMPFGKGAWINGEYYLGENDLKNFYDIASSYQRQINITLFQKNEHGWYEKEMPYSLPPKMTSSTAGASTVLLVKII